MSTSSASLSDSDNTIIAQKLSLKYDDVFNKNYDKINSLTSQISSNEDLIRTYNEENFKLEVQNAVLKIIAIATVIIFVAVFLYKAGLFGSSFTLLATIVGGIVVLAMLFIYYTYYMSDYDAYLERISRKTGEKMDEGSDEPIGNEFNCDLYEEEGEAVVGDVDSDVQNYDLSTKTSLLKSDSDYNVWLDGDHKSTNPINENRMRYVDSKYGEDVKGKYDGISPEGATYYDCRFKGADYNGEPFKKDILKTTVPCKYYIDYDEVAKYTRNGSTFTKI